MDARKLQILNMEEETWRLKSRATWIKKGDYNTKFSHIMQITYFFLLILFGSLSWRMGRLQLVNMI